VKYFTGLNAPGADLGMRGKVIVTTFEKSSNSSEDDSVTEKVTGVTFENACLASPIMNLTSSKVFLDVKFVTNKMA
jgi:hypothetical protein